MIPYDVLDKANIDVNHLLTYCPDGLVDKWEKAAITEVSKTGDCEDYAITKASRLIKLFGCSPDDLRIGKFRTTKGTYHAMLIAESEYTKGFFRKTKEPCRYLLDNRWNAIYRMDQVRDKLIIEYRVESFI